MTMIRFPHIGIKKYIEYLNYSIPKSSIYPDKNPTLETMGEICKFVFQYMYQMCRADEIAYIYNVKKDLMWTEHKKHNPQPIRFNII